MASRPVEGTKMVAKYLPVGSRTCAPGLEERDVDSLKKLTRLYTPYVLARGRSTVRLEEMD